MRSPAHNPAANLATPSQKKHGIPPCAPVNASQPNSLQQLARQHSAPLQDKYSSIATLKPLI
jgi:D-alanyl-D-alanine carboxypeptidase